MDKSWMSKDRMCSEYEKGVEEFLEFAKLHSNNPNSIRCPCERCGNLIFQNPGDVRKHLFSRGIDRSYTIWVCHGEEHPIRGSTSFASRSEQAPNYKGGSFEDAADAVEMVNAAYEHVSGDPKSFKSLLEDAEKPLYPGCSKYTKLSGLMRLYNIKGRYGWSDNSFSELLKCLHDMLPTQNEIPSSMYEAKKIMTALGLEYEKIHACPNDCILYRKEYSDLSECPTCGISRWKKENDGSHQIPIKKIPAKVLWYFPPIPRFKRMFQSSQTSRDLTWHASERVADGKLRHPADSSSWKLVDQKWPDFAKEPRNLRLALSADGINPHRSLSSKYSCWPVILVTYNLPPWLCMKRKFMMLSLLISGPHQPGNDIDVYLAPLVEDLKVLWEEGVEAYDVQNQEFFTLKAVLLWTINDFPAYGNLSGCTTKGYYACPICGEDTYAPRLKHSGKNVYTGTRRFLPRHHPYRSQKKVFDGKQEFRGPPTPLSGKEILEKVGQISNSWGKKHEKCKASKFSERRWMKKKSIFFTLDYWEYLHVRHTLDVMHIEKNVCESIYGTLLNIPGKTKDGVNARLDLVDMGLRTELKPDFDKKRTYLPRACYTLTKDEKKIFCQTLLDIKVPEGYSSNIRNLVSMEDLKLYGLKSHDCHALMQQLLPVAIRSVLPKPVRVAITRFCFFFNAICKKVVDVNMLNDIQNDLVVTLCMLEKYFPPSFFDIMVHLTLHLVEQVKICGPVFLTWMYPFERCMKPLKGYVRNHNRPEGCIAECYIAEEAIEFCSEYLSHVEAIGNPLARKGNIQDGKPLPGGRLVAVDREEWQQAHLYVLENTDEIEPYIDEHMEWLLLQYPLKSKNRKWLQDKHNQTFIYWLQEKVDGAFNVKEDISETVKWVAQGPSHHVLKCSGYVINGCRYHTKDRDNARVSQNSGVSLVATTMQIASSKDKNPIVGDMCFYGVIKEIWELDYHRFTIPVFKCDWVESKGVKVDELGFTSVNLNRVGYKSDCFILASQAKQVFYVKDQLDPQWSVVLSTSPKEYLHNEDDEDLDNSMEHHPFTNALLNDGLFDVGDDDNVCYKRTSNVHNISHSNNSKKRKAKEVLQMNPPHVEYVASKKATRGPTMLERTIKRRSDGMKKIVTFNEAGQPIGEAGAECVSFLGVIARSMIPITYDDWRKVPTNIKDNAWASVEQSFIIDPRAKRNLMQTMGVATKSFRHALTDYVLANMDNLAHLKNPPPNYSFINPNQWSKFVTSRLSEDFQKRRIEQQNRRGKHVYNHRLSRKGYAGLREEIKKDGTYSEEDVDRCLFWKLARKKQKRAKGGSNEHVEEDDSSTLVYDPVTQAMVDKIDEVKKKITSGELSIPENRDALCYAMERPEHTGRVTAMGKYVTPRSFFHTPKAPIGWEEEKKKLLDEIEMKNKMINNLLSQGLCGTPISDTSSNFPEKLVTASIPPIPTMNAPSSPSEGSRRPSHMKKVINAHSPIKTNVELVLAEKQPECEKNKTKESMVVKEAPKEKTKTPSKVKSPTRASTRITRSFKNPPGMEYFAILAQRLVTEKTSVRVPFDSDLFGTPTITTLLQEDFENFINMRPLSVNCIQIYIRSLYYRLKDLNSDENVSFIDPRPSNKSGIKEFLASQDRRARHICNSLNSRKESRLFFLPYNPSDHWVLVVIDLLLMRAYYLDSLGSCICDDLKHIVTSGLRMFHAQCGNQVKKFKLNWIAIQVPNQTGSIECGYYVMRYMKEISYDRSLLNPKYNEKCVYTFDEINEVRTEWMDHVSQFLI